MRDFILCYYSLRTFDSFIILMISSSSSVIVYSLSSSELTVLYLSTKTSSINFCKGVQNSVPTKIVGIWSILFVCFRVYYLGWEVRHIGGPLSIVGLVGLSR